MKFSTGDKMIRPMKDQDIGAVLNIWNECATAGEVVYKPLQETDWRRKMIANPECSSTEAYVDEEDGIIAGFVIGHTKRGDGAVSANGYLTGLFVRRDECGKGIGRKLEERLEDAFAVRGIQTILCSGSNPVNLEWLIPGTPGHGHNNAPGVDEECSGYAFLRKLGFVPTATEIAMYLNLADYQIPADFEERKNDLKKRGVNAGIYDARLRYDYDGMCDRVGSEYWREALKSEIACHLENRPNSDLRFIPDGEVPAGPRPIMAATCDGKIVAQAGPVCVQSNGRGYFTGICTDPLFERRGIGSVLFHCLMQEMIAQGAQYASLFTGESNHAQKIYLQAGFRPVRRWVLMKKSLTEAQVRDIFLR